MNDQENKPEVLTKREMIAAMMMQGLLSNSAFLYSATAKNYKKEDLKKDLPTIAVAAADLLIDELKK